MGPAYVQRLYHGVKRNLSGPFGFVLFSNDRDLKIEEGIQTQTFCPPSWKGCLPRLWMFSPRSGLQGQILALDIDIVIVGSLDDIAAYRGRFCARSKFKPGYEQKLDGDIVGFRADREITKQIWNPFTRDVKKAERFTGGRERYWYRKAVPEADRWQKLFPGQIVSYKRHVRNKGLPPEARIVSCHGEPRPHQINEPWREEHWR